MTRSRSTRRRLGVLGLYGTTFILTGGCLPENYFGTLFTRLTTSAADFAVLSVLDFALREALPETNDMNDGNTDGAENGDAM